MKIFEIFPRFLDALNDGRGIRKAVACALWVGAGLTTLAALLVPAIAIRLAFAPSSSPESAFGLVLFLVVYLLSAVCQVQILLYRTKSVLALENSPYTVVPIVCLLLRGAGECIASGFCFLGLGAALAIVFKRDPRGVVGLPGINGLKAFLPSVDASDSLVSGAVTLAGSFLMAFAALILFYFLAEVFHAVVDIAKNVRLLAASGPQPMPAPAPPPPPDIPPPPPAGSICPTCRFVLQPDDRSCPICGTSAPQ